jgi:hypothetical protein
MLRNPARQALEIIADYILTLRAVNHVSSVTSVTRNPSSRNRKPDPERIQLP